MKRICAMLLTLAVLATGAAPAAKVIDGVFINVNGNAVTYSEFREFVAHRLRISEGDAEEFLSKERSREKLKGLTNAFIDAKLISFELEKFGDRVKKEDLDGVIQRILDENGFTEEDFEQALGREGITLGAYRQNLRQEMEKSRVIRALKGKEVLVTDEEAKHFYLENRDRFKRNFKVMLTMLSFPLQLPEEPDELIRFREIVSGADEIVEHGGKLEEVRNFLQSRGIPVKSSVQGPVSVDDLSKELKDEVASLAAGETSRSTIVKDRIAFIQVAERRGGEYMPFEDVKGAINEEMVSKRSIGAIKEIIEELRSRSYIEVYLQ